MFEINNVLCLSLRQIGFIAEESVSITQKWRGWIFRHFTSSQRVTWELSQINWEKRILLAQDTMARLLQTSESVFTQDRNTESTVVKYSFTAYNRLTRVVAVNNNSAPDIRFHHTYIVHAAFFF